LLVLVAGSLRRPSSASSPVSSAVRVIAGQLPTRTASSICENLRNLRINQTPKKRGAPPVPTSTRACSSRPEKVLQYPQITQISTDYNRRVQRACRLLVLVAGSLRRSSGASSPVSSAARVIAGQLPTRTASSICENLRNLRINQTPKKRGAPPVPTSTRACSSRPGKVLQYPQITQISTDYYRRVQRWCRLLVLVAGSLRRPSSASSPVSSAARVIAGQWPTRTALSICENLRNLRINQGQRSAARRLCQQAHELAHHDREKSFNIRRLRRFPQITTDVFSAGAGCLFSLPEACVGRAVPAVLSAALPGLLPASCRRARLHQSAKICVICG
jgi:hypothetical protein